MKNLIFIFLFFPILLNGQLLGDYFEPVGHPKAKGLNFKIRVPLGFEQMEADRPNIVQKWVKNKGSNLIVFLVLVKNIPDNLKGISRQDLIQYLKFESGVQDIASAQSSNISVSKYVALDNMPGYYFEFSDTRTQVDKTLTMPGILIEVFVEDFKFEIMMISPNNHFLEQHSALFHILANSVVFPSQYEQKSTSEINKAKLSVGDYYSRANEKSEKGDYEGAIADYTKVIELNNSPFAYYDRGIAKIKLNDFHGALLDLNMAIEINPNYADAYYARGSSKSDLKDYDGAISDYTQSIKINPNFDHAYNDRGVTKSQSGDHKGAINDYTKAININPNYIDAYNNRGVSRYLLRNKSGACDDWNIATNFGSVEAKEYLNKFCD